MTPAQVDWRAEASGSRWPAWMGLALVHVGVLGLLLSASPTHPPAPVFSPLTVQLLSPPAPRPAKAKPVLPSLAPKSASSISRARPPPQPSPPTASAEMSRSVAAPAPAPREEAATGPEPVVTAKAVEIPAPSFTPPVFNAAYLDNPAPEYPIVSRKLRHQGRVLLRVQVSAEGRSSSVALEHSSGDARLDQSAIDAVRRWRFVPARHGTEVVAATVLVPIDFQLEH